MANSTEFLSRRQILRRGRRAAFSAGAAAMFGRLGMMNAFAQTADYRALVCVFLFGGNDSNNTVIPITTTKNVYADYSNIRKQVAIAQASLLPVTSGSETYGFHPAMDDLQNIYLGGKLAVVANVGTLSKPLTKSEYQSKTATVPANLFSHADQQAQWQTADPTGRGASGWAGRVADLIGPGYNVPPSGTTHPFPTGVSLAGNSILMIGNNSAPAVATTNGVTKPANWPATPDARVRAFTNLLSFDNGARLIQSSNEIMRAALDDSRVLDAALSASTFNPAFPATSLGNQLKMIARIINVHSELGASRQIFFASMGGFDNHDKLLTDQNTNLTQVSDALGAFYAALQSLGLENNVTAFTESDFSRTNQPNTGGGSDHAWGSHQIVLGGSVKSAVYGTFPTLTLSGPDDVTGRGVYLPTTSLDQYGATLAKWFGVQDADLSTVFPNLANFPTNDLGFLS